MRRRQLKWLWARLAELSKMQLTREALLMRLGAARAKARAAWRLVQVEVAEAELDTTKIDKSKVDQSKVTKSKELKSEPDNSKIDKSKRLISASGVIDLASSCHVSSVATRALRRVLPRLRAL